MAFNFHDALRCGILLLGNCAEDFLDLGLGALHVNVSNHNHGLVSGMIPLCVEAVEGFRNKGLKVLLGADEGVHGRLGAFAEVVGEAALHGTPLGVAALAALLYDYSALCIDLGGLVEHIV